jgi:DNA-binding IclR family transcriptional regulator
MSRDRSAAARGRVRPPCGLHQAAGRRRRLIAIIRAFATAASFQPLHQIEHAAPKWRFDPARLRKRIKTAREQGYAIITNETVVGDISVASCIVDEHGRAIAGISISVPTTRWTLKRAESELVKHVQLLAASLSSTQFPAYR